MTAELKVYTVEVGSGGWYWVKGHVSPVQFLDQVEAEQGASGWRPDEVRHTYLCCTPDSTGEYDMLYYECPGPARGATPVTLVET